MSNQAEQMTPGRPVGPAEESSARLLYSVQSGSAVRQAVASCVE